MESRAACIMARTNDAVYSSKPLMAKMISEESPEYLPPFIENIANALSIQKEQREEPVDDFPF
jgi:hypothetical protein